MDLTRRLLHFLVVYALLTPLLPGADQTVVWGGVSDGLRLGLSYAPEDHATGQDAVVTFHIENVGPPPVKILALDQQSVEFGHSHGLEVECLTAELGWPLKCRFFIPFTRGDNTITLASDEVRRISLRAGEGRILLHPEVRQLSQHKAAVWPPLPGCYVLRGVLTTSGPAEKAQKAGLWTGRLASGQLKLDAPALPFLERMPDDPTVKQERVDQLFVKADCAGLMEIGDRKACLALIGLLRRESVSSQVLTFLDKHLGAAPLSDYVRATHDEAAVIAHTAGRVIGKSGSKREIEAVRAFLNDPRWRGRDGLIVGLGDSQTEESLELLGALAKAGSAEAVGSLSRRVGKRSEELLLSAMQAGTASASDEAARVLAGRGSDEAVKWLAAHWDWLNAAAFVNAPIQWPAPKDGMFTKEQALETALAALPQLGREKRIDPPVTRYLDNKWYIVLVSGHPQRVGRFYYAIVNATTGQLEAHQEVQVLR